VTLDRLIHEPARLVLMANLAVVDEADFVYLSRQTGFTAGNISSHMARLENAGYEAFERYREDVAGILAGPEAGAE
jgi:hypothetical protein